MQRNAEDVEPISARTARPLEGVNMIIVDDVSDIRELLSRILRRAGAQVRTAASADTALAAVSAETPDVILTDLGMPDIDGFGLLDRVCRLPRAGIDDILVIALTGFVSTDYRDRCLAAGFQAYLTKPIEADVLLATIARAVRDRRPPPTGPGFGSCARTL